jgi:hypothetical protein
MRAKESKTVNSPGPPIRPQATKLTWSKVQAIRRSHAAGTSYGQIEARYGISRQWAIAIVKGRAWKVEG